MPAGTAGAVQRLDLRACAAADRGQGIEGLAAQRVVGRRRGRQSLDCLGRCFELPRASQRTAAFSITRSDRSGADWISTASRARSFVGRKLRLAAASARASRALSLMGAGKLSGAISFSKQVLDVAGVATFADHVDDRALPGLGNAPALEQLDERAVGRRFVGVRGRCKNCADEYHEEQIDVA